MPDLLTSGFPPAPGMCPPEIVNGVVNAIVGGAPFARSLTRYNTASGAVSWPVIEPSGQAWVSEGQPLPVITLGDRSYISVVKKLAGTLPISNETIRDSAFNITAALGTALMDGFGPELDDGLLNGDGTGANPVGLLGFADAVDGPDLFSAAMTAAGEIGDSGGAANVLGVAPSTAAAEAVRVGSDGHLVFPNGFANAGPLNVVGIPALVGDAAKGVVYDSTRVFLVVNTDFEVALSPHEQFSRDLTVMRVRGRFAVAVPAEQKSIRKLTVTAAPLATRSTKSN